MKMFYLTMLLFAYNFSSTMNKDDGELPTTVFCKYSSSTMKQDQDELSTAAVCEYSDIEYFSSTMVKEFNGSESKSNPMQDSSSTAKEASKELPFVYDEKELKQRLKALNSQDENDFFTKLKNKIEDKEKMILETANKPFVLQDKKLDQILNYRFKHA